MSEPIVLTADVYDTLELSAYVYGGIGGAMFSDYLGFFGEAGAPLCVFGHAARSGISPACGLPFEATDNDIAVKRVNEQRGKPDGARISFRRWCKELNVVRGAA